MRKRLQQTGRGLGSDILLTVIDENESVFTGIWESIAAFELSFSRFLPDSELSKVNRSAGMLTPISESMRSILLAAIHMGEETGGLFNPLILPDLQRAGYIGSWPNVTVGTNYTHRVSYPISHLEVGDSWMRIPADAAIDLGGIGKGYLLDQLAGYVDGLPGYWFSLGGDIIADGKDIDDQEWKIGVAESDANITITKKTAIATSGITKRKGNGWHHIIDPHTGKPAKTDILTATLAAKTGVEADVWATCVVILGSDNGRRFAEGRGAEHIIIQSI